MQALFILPLLMSVLAMAISLLAPVWPGAIIMVDLAMLSLVQAIMAAETGVKAKVESIAAAIRILISTSLGKETSELLASGYAFSPETFRKKTLKIFLCAAVQRKANGEMIPPPTSDRASAARRCCRSRFPRHITPCRVPGPDTCRRFR